MKWKETGKTYLIKKLSMNIKPKKKIKILVFFVFTSIFLSSCSAVGLKNEGSKFVLSNIWVSSFSKIIYGYPDAPISREMVEAIPYASMKVKIGKGPGGLMILQKIENKKLSWVSKDEVMIQIENGRIIRTSNLNNDLVDYYYANDIPFYDLLNNIDTKMLTNVVDEGSFRKIFNFLNFNEKISNKNSHKSGRVISLSNPSARHLELTVRTSYKDELEEINILDYEYNLIKVTETIENKMINWKYDNTYWVDPENGFVWKSIQQMAPNVPPIILEITKAPS